MSNTFLSAAVVTAGLIVATLGATSMVTSHLSTMEQKRLTNQAVDECMRAATLTTTHDVGERVAVTVEPIKDIYTFCLADKGVSVK